MTRQRGNNCPECARSFGPHYRGECTHGEDIATSAEQAYGAMGFSLIETGGGCTAFHKSISGARHILITVTDDPEAPTEAAQPVAVGLYDDASPSEGEMFYAPDCDAVAAKLAEKGWE